MEVFHLIRQIVLLSYTCITLTIVCGNSFINPNGACICPVMISSLRSQYFLHGNVKTNYRSSGDLCE